MVVSDVPRRVDEVPMTEERPRGIFTPTDREFITGEKEYDNKQSERDARYRIRERAYNGLLDLKLVFSLDDKDLELVTKKVSEEDIDGIREFAEYMEARRELREKKQSVFGREDS